MLSCSTTVISPKQNRHPITHLWGWGMGVLSEFNSLAPGRFEWNFRCVIFNLISVIDGWSISWRIALKWLPLDLKDGRSTLVQIMDRSHQATSHYLSQYWLRYVSPYGIIRPQWVISLWPCDTIWQQDCCQHWLTYWLVTWKHQAITWTNVDLSSKVFCGIHLRAISQDLVNLIHNMSLEMTLLE